MQNVLKPMFEKKFTNRINVARSNSFFWPTESFYFDETKYLANMRLNISSSIDKISLKLSTKKKQLESKIPFPKSPSRNLDKHSKYFSNGYNKLIQTITRFYVFFLNSRYRGSKKKIFWRKKLGKNE